jgi:acyl-CoA synthetase (AMP-forming)/AMP-acid ligase II
VQTIPEALAFWAARTPGAPALRSLDDRTWSFWALHEVTTGIGARLAARGIAPGDRVALVLPPGCDACVALLGTMAAATAVPLNPAMPAPELCRDLERLQPRLLVVDTDGETAGREAGARLGIPTVALDDLTAAAGTMDTNGWQSLATPDGIAAILHTSGTTGLPKRVPRPHRTWLAAARAARRCTALTPDDILLLTASLHNNAGLANLCAALGNGGACVVTPGFDPAAYPAWLEASRATWTVSTAAELNLILDAAAAAGRERVAGPSSRLRIVRAGAQPMTPGTAERVEQSFAALVCDGFGMTEASYITGSGPDPADRREGSCGPPLNSEIRIRDDQGQDLPPGATGEVVIRGETLFPGYLDDPEANTAAFLPGGWFRTGDQGSLDPDGYLSLTGRLKELINRGGEKISPVEVDRVLLTHPAIAEAATFGVPDARLGEDIVAAIVFRPGMTVPLWELRGWLLDRLAPAKVPRRIWVTTELPRTGRGKVQRGAIAQRWRED